jgi:hypothetical protein
MHRFNSHIALGALLAFSAAGTPCLADETPAAQPAASTSTVLNVKVARDKETGQLRAMTAQEEADLKANAKPVAPTIIEIRRPVTTTEYRADGSMTGKLSMADMENLELVRTPDGRSVMQHTDAASTTPAPAAAELPTE